MTSIGQLGQNFNSSPISSSTAARSADTDSGLGKIAQDFSASKASTVHPTAPPSPSPTPGSETVEPADSSASNLSSANPPVRVLRKEPVLGRVLFHVRLQELPRENERPRHGT